MQNFWFELATILKPATEGKQLDCLLDYNPMHKSNHEGRGLMLCTLSLQSCFHHKNGEIIQACLHIRVLDLGVPLGYQ